MTKHITLYKHLGLSGFYALGKNILMVTLFTVGVSKNFEKHVKNWNL